MANGKPHGHGVYLFLDGSKLITNFVDGRPEPSAVTKAEQQPAGPTLAATAASAAISPLIVEPPPSDNSNGPSSRPTTPALEVTQEFIN